MRAYPGTIFLLVAVLAYVCPTAEAQETSTLEPGRPVTRQLRSGGRHSYSLTLATNQTVEIECEQMGVDVVMTAVDPGGNVVSVSNAAAAFAGIERLFFIADAAGSYRIDVESGRPGTVAGSYTLLLAATRRPSENDVVRAEAMKLTGETRALLLTSDGRFERATHAATKLDRAVALFEKANDRQGMANALFHLGTIIGNEF